MTEPVWPAEPFPAQQKLHQPWRVGLAATELVLAALAIWGAFALWPMGINDVVLRLSSGESLVSTHYTGSWIFTAIVVGTLAAVLVIDALRQLALGTRVRTRGR